MSTIILTGGGTAGHVMPHLSLLPYLKTKYDKIYYIGSQNGMEKNIIQNSNIPYYSIPCAKLKRSFDLSNLAIPFKVTSGIIEAKKLIKKLKPDIIFSKGGYVSIPVVIACHLKKIPVISHESDLSIGLANKINARYSIKLLTTFKETSFKVKNGQYVGAPLSDKLFSVNRTNALKRFGFTGEKPILLVTGGSLGAKVINDALISSLPKLLGIFDIIHLFGKGNQISYKKQSGYYACPFLTDIQDAFNLSSVVVTRAGSNTLFELLALEKPCLVIPLSSNVSRGDQLLNAKYFYDKGMIDLLYQEQLTKDSLVFNIMNTYYNSNKLIANIKQNKIQNGTINIFNTLLNYTPF